MMRPVFIAGFWLTASAALSYYINSSFLSGLVGEKRVGLVYAGAAAGAGFLILATPKIGRCYGLLWPSRVLALVLTSGYLGLSLINSSFIQLGLFTAIYGSIVTLGLWLDLYLETLSRDATTGRTRGGYLTMINLAILLAPFASGAVLSSGGDYRSVFRLGFIASLPLLYQLLFKFKDRDLPRPRLAIREKLSDHNLRRILGLDFLLNCFYFIMVIYLPLHLHQTLGFPWERIGLIFTIMLVPFVLIQYPLGWLADRRFGEREILTVGLALTGLATLPIAWLDSRLWLVWAGLLFATRVGASAWEAMKESYLFKQVTAGDAGVISLSRLMVPLAYLTGSLISFFWLKILPLPHLFTLVGLLILSSLFLSIRLKDSR